MFNRTKYRCQCHEIKDVTLDSYNCLTLAQPTLAHSKLKVRHFLTRPLLTKNFRYNIFELDICLPTNICSPGNEPDGIFSPWNDNHSLATRHLVTFGYPILAIPMIQHFLIRHLLTPLCETCSPDIDSPPYETLA